MMGSVAVTLALFVVVVHLPLEPHPLRVGWRSDPSKHPITLTEIQPDAPPPRPEPSAGTPITRFPDSIREASSSDEGSGDAGKTVAETILEEPPLPEAPIERMVLAFAEEMPTIQGGLGTYYINIQYPEAAIQAGIQGRLVLDFIVEPDGKPTHIKIFKSLHPLCDSAAVQALRKTVFMPGRQGGKTVPVRMRLPVSFRLIDEAPADTTHTST